MAAIFTLTLNPVLDRTYTVPALRLNEVLRASEVHLDFGGKGFNVSRALKLLGLESQALGFTAGAVGSQLEKGLNDLGIDTNFVIVEGETRTNMVIIEEEGGTFTKVNEPGPTISAASLDGLIDKVQERLAPHTNWVLSGSLPPGIPASIYAILIQLIKASGGRTFLDTSGEALSLGCKAAPFLVKPNREEAAQASGKPIASSADLLDITNIFLSCGIEIVALSAGADGLWLANPTTKIHAKPPAITVHNPVGNGDALMAGLVWAFTNDLSLEEAARWGAACGTVSAMGAGVNFGTRSLIEEMLERITVEIL